MALAGCTKLGPDFLRPEAALAEQWADAGGPVREDGRDWSPSAPTSGGSRIPRTTAEEALQCLHFPRRMVAPPVSTSGTRRKNEKRNRRFSLSVRVFVRMAIGQ